MAQPRIAADPAPRRPSSIITDRDRVLGLVCPPCRLYAAVFAAAWTAPRAEQPVLVRLEEALDRYYLDRFNVTYDY